MVRRRKAQQYAEAASADARWKAMVAKMPRNMQDSAASSLPGSLRAQFGDGAALLPPAAHCLSTHIIECCSKEAGPSTAAYVMAEVMPASVHICSRRRTFLILTGAAASQAAGEKGLQAEHRDLLLKGWAISHEEIQICKKVRWPQQPATAGMCTKMCT
jgi:hypothetical protein